MGACRTTVGTQLSKRLKWEFKDADDFHTESNREKMRSGIPLTDEDRGPWLQSLNALMKA
jgi:gluconokinase